MVGMFLALVGHELAKTCPKGCVQGFFAIFGVAEGLWCATGKGACRRWPSSRRVPAIIKTERAETRIAEGWGFPDRSPPRGRQGQEG